MITDIVTLTSNVPRNYVKGVKRHFIRVSMLRTLREDGKYEERDGDDNRVFEMN